MKIKQQWMPILAALCVLLPLASAAAQQAESMAVCEEGVISEPVTMGIGQSTSACEVGTATDRDRFSVVAQSGETLRIIVLSATNFFDPQIDIRDPNGTVLETQFCLGQNSFGNGIRCSFSVEIVAPQTGQYDLAVSDQGSNETGGYTMQVESLPPQFVPDLTAYDQPVVDQIAPGTDLDFFAFHGSVGTEVRVNLLSATNFYDARIEIFAPDGSAVDSVSCAGQNSFGNGIRCSTQLDFSPTMTGSYMVVTSDSASNEVGSYEFSVFCLSGPCDSNADGVPDAAPDVLAYDSPVSKSINSGTDGEFLTFYGAADTTIQLNVLSSANFFDPRIEIRDSLGALIVAEQCLGQNSFGNGIRCSFSTLLTLAQTDLYRIVFYDSATNETGGAQFSLFCLHGLCDSDGDGTPDELAPMVSYVSTTTSDINSATDGNFFRLYGTADSVIRLDLVSTQTFYDPTVVVRDPDGNVVISNSCAGQNSFGNGIRCSFSEGLVVPVTGFYDIAVYDSATNESGGQSFTVHCLRGDCDSDADGLLDPVPGGLAYDQARGAPISPATDLDQWLIHGTAGDDIALVVASMTNFFDPRVEVFAPDGSLLATQFCAGQNSFGNGIMCSFSLALDDLPADGLYRLAVSDSGVNETGNYEITPQCIFGTCANPPPPATEGDNCIEFANSVTIPDAGGNAQLDTDGDGIGNHCDADLNDDCVVNAGDLGILRQVFFSGDLDADFNGDGQVNFIDLGIMRRVFFADFTVDSPSGIPDACDL